MDLLPLLDWLAVALPSGPCKWLDWQIHPLSGGRNNLLFRAACPTRDLVVKFTRRDPRDRAGREFYGLTLLQALAPGLAPAPVYLERERYSCPVIVQTWVEGESSDQPPCSPTEWLRLLDHYTAIHRITLAQVVAPHSDVPHSDAPYPPAPHCNAPLLDHLRPAALTFYRANDAVQAVLEECSRLPAEAQKEGLLRLMRLLAETPFPTWPEPAAAFCRCDPNIVNFLRPPGGGPWISVDWENSGWGDPAFEIGDLMAHPCYKEVPRESWDGCLKALAERRPGDATFILRARAYFAIMLVRFAGVFARSAVQYERGMQENGRLVPWPQSWWDAVPQEYSRYLLLAEQALRDFRK